MKRLLEEKDLPDGCLLWALEQTQGRGQTGRKWNSEAGKNLTFSILKRFDRLLARDQFLIHMWASLAICNTLVRLGVPDVSVKWPNDILSGNRKICGILPENSLSRDRVVRTVLGVGLNVNQTEFPGLPGAGSLKSTTGEHFELEELLLTCYHTLQGRMNAPRAMEYELQRAEYEGILFRMNAPASFRREGIDLTGKIRGVDRTGRLQLEHADGSIRSYSSGEIRMQY